MLTRALDVSFGKIIEVIGGMGSRMLLSILLVSLLSSCTGVERTSGRARFDSLRVLTSCEGSFGTAQGYTKIEKPWRAYELSSNIEAFFSQNRETVIVIDTANGCRDHVLGKEGALKVEFPDLSDLLDTSPLEDEIYEDLEALRADCETDLWGEPASNRILFSEVSECGEKLLKSIEVIRISSEFATYNYVSTSVSSFVWQEKM